MTMRVLIRLSIAAALGLGAALLVSCGSTGKGLIPVANAGPLRRDFEAVAKAAAAGDGQCAATTRAIEKTESDFQLLPSSVDTRLRSHLSEGIENLRSKALALCEQPQANTGTSTTRSTKSTPTITTRSTPTITIQSTPTTTTQASIPPAPGGGTQAPSEKEHEEEVPAGPGVGKGGEPPGHEKEAGGTGGTAGEDGEGNK
jgi:hypothetical protein